MPYRRIVSKRSEKIRNLALIEVITGILIIYFCFSVFVLLYDPYKKESLYAIGGVVTGVLDIVGGVLGLLWFVRKTDGMALAHFFASVVLVAIDIASIILVAFMLPFYLHEDKYRHPEMIARAKNDKSTVGYFDDRDGVTDPPYSGAAKLLIVMEIFAWLSLLAHLVCSVISADMMRHGCCCAEVDDFDVSVLRTPDSTRSINLSSTSVQTPVSAPLAKETVAPPVVVTETKKKPISSSSSPVEKEIGSSSSGSDPTIDEIKKMSFAPSPAPVVRRGVSKKNDFDTSTDLSSDS